MHRVCLFWPRRPGGFTTTEILVIVGVLVLLVATLIPLALKLIDDSRVSRAETEAEAIATALATLYKDTAMWAYTDASGPSGKVDRLIGSANVPTAVGAGAGTGARRWGTFGSSKPIGDFLFWNNPDNNSSAKGGQAGEPGRDYPTSGRRAWKGPYVDSYNLEDPWGNAYVVNVRFLPGGSYSGDHRHKTLVLSAGPDGQWQTPWNDDETEEILGDDIGYVLHVR